MHVVSKPVLHSHTGVVFIPIFNVILVQTILIQAHLLNIKMLVGHIQFSTKLIPVLTKTELLLDLLI